MGIEDDRLMSALDARQVDVFHHDWLALHELEKRLPPDPKFKLEQGVFPTYTGYDAALVNLPKGRDFARAVLVRALSALREGAFLFAVGGSDTGAKTAQTDLNALAPARTLATKARQRLIAAERPARIESPAAWGTPWQATQQVFQVLGQAYPVFTQPGIFSHAHLDDGTAFLLANLPTLPPGGAVLDAGCGVGIVGMVAQGALGAARVVAVDTNLLAVDCARLNLPDALVLPADVTTDPLSAHAPFDLIVCNPPFHQEHTQTNAFMMRFARHAPGLLTPGGQLVIVANRFLPYQDLLAAHFPFVAVIAVDSRYQVLSARRDPSV